MSRAPSYLIAIAGGSGSGKSTLADALIDRLGPDLATIFHEDAYYWPMAHYGPCTTDAERVAVIESIDYDDPASKDAAHLARDLATLKSGEPVDQPIYDYDRHDRRPGETRTLGPAPVILLEGIHALSIPEIAGMIDLSVYVDTPDDLRLARRLRRDVLDRGRSIESVLTQYLGNVRAAHYRHTHPAKFSADLVIADEGLPAYGDLQPSEDAINRMIATLLDRLAAAGLI